MNRGDSAQKIRSVISRRALSARRTQMRLHFLQNAAHQRFPQFRKMAFEDLRDCLLDNLIKRTFLCHCSLTTVAAGRELLPYS
jgi:hypothetical protein